MNLVGWTDGAGGLLCDCGCVKVNLTHKCICTDEDSESDADEEEVQPEYEYEYEDSVSTEPGDDDATMRARLLAFLGVGEEKEEGDAGAKRTEVDLDGIVDPRERPEPRFLSYVLRVLPSLFPNVEALSLQSLGLGAGKATEVGGSLVCLEV
jgi:hypothetical protein